MQYTIQNLPGNNFKLQSVDSNESLNISEDHAKFAYVANQASLPNRIIKWDGTKMTSTKDYRGHYNKSTQSPKAPKKPVVVTLTKLDDLNINDNLFIPITIKAVIRTAPIILFNSKLSINLVITI